MIPLGKFRPYEGKETPLGSAGAGRCPGKRNWLIVGLENQLSRRFAHTTNLHPNRFQPLYFGELMFPLSTQANNNIIAA